MALNWQDSDVLVHVENTRHFEMMSPRRKGGFEGIQKLAEYWKVKVADYMERYGLEIKVDPLQNDGSQSWICDQQRS